MQQGKLEASNVGPPNRPCAWSAIMRQFEMLQKAVGLGGDMGSQAIQEVAKVGLEPRGNRDDPSTYTAPPAE